MPRLKRNPSPVDLLNAYNEGLVGYIHQPRKIEQLLGELPHPLFGEASNLKGSGDKVKALLYLSVRKFDKTLFEDEAQTTSDCTSHGGRNAADLSRAVEIDIKGELEEWIVRGATEILYKSRGSNGPGMGIYASVKFLNSTGGVLLRKKYPELGLDLTKYNSSIGIRGREGISPDILKEARKHQIKTVSQIRSVEEAVNALANGYGITCGSNYGFSSKRDQEGFARPQGSWNHCMAWGAADTEYKRPGILILNSWGKFNSGPKRNAQPDGSFWVDLEVAEKMIKQGATFAVSNFEGFPSQKLPRYVDYDIML